MALEDDLKKDLMKAEEASNLSGIALGAPAPREKFNVKGVMIEGRAALKKELAALDNAMNDAVRELSSRATQLDAIEREKFENSLRERFNQVKLATLREAGRTAKALKKEQISEEKKLQLMKALTGGASIIAQSAIGGSTGSSPTNYQQGSIVSLGGQPAQVGRTDIGTDYTNT